MRRTCGDAGPEKFGQLTQFLATTTAILALGLVEGAEAQAVDTAGRAKLRAECRLAHQVLTTGQPSVKREWAVGKIGACRDLGGEAIAAELDRLRSAEERTDRLERIVWVTNRFVDRAIARTALNVATDPGAGDVARVQAIRVLSFQVAPATNASYEGFVQPGGAMFIRATGSVVVGTALTPETCARIRSELSEIHDDASAPESVRIAARNVAGQVAARSSPSTCGRQ